MMWTRQWYGTLMSCVILGSAWGLELRAGEEVGTGMQQYDCGTLALHILLQLEGRSAELRRIEGVLPACSSDGYSMKELREAAASCGLSLSGIELSGRERLLDRAALAFMNYDTHGHYVVIRPVGHTKQLVQIIDPSGAPEVVDMARLQSSRGWTGLALVPRRQKWNYVVSAAVFGMVLILASRYRSLLKAVGSLLGRHRNSQGLLGDKV